MRKSFIKLMTAVILATTVIMSITVNTDIVEAASKPPLKLEGSSTRNDTGYYDFDYTKNTEQESTIQKVSSKEYNATLYDGEHYVSFLFRAAKGYKAITLGCKDTPNLKFTLSEDPYGAKGIEIGAVKESLQKDETANKTIKIGVVKDGKAFKWANASSVVTINITLKRAHRPLESAKTYLETLGYKDSLTDLEKYLFVRLCVGEHMNYTKQTDYRNCLTLGIGGECSQFAWNFELLCNAVGLECYYKSLDEYGVDHAMNICKLDGKWYLTDVTERISQKDSEITLGSVLRGYSEDVGAIGAGASKMKEVTVKTYRDGHSGDDKETVSIEQVGYVVPTKYYTFDSEIRPSTVGYIVSEEVAIESINYYKLSFMVENQAIIYYGRYLEAIEDYGSHYGMKPDQDAIDLAKSVVAQLRSELDEGEDYVAYDALGQDDFSFFTEYRERIERSFQ